MSIISCFHPIHHLSSFKSSKCHKLIEFDFSLILIANEGVERNIWVLSDDFKARQEDKARLKIEKEAAKKRRKLEKQRVPCADEDLSVFKGRVILVD